WRGVVGWGGGRAPPLASPLSSRHAQRRLSRSRRAKGGAASDQGKELHGQMNENEDFRVCVCGETLTPFEEAGGWCTACIKRRYFDSGCSESFGRAVEHDAPEPDQARGGLRLRPLSEVQPRQGGGVVPGGVHTAAVALGSCV